MGTNKSIDYTFYLACKRWPLEQAFNLIDGLEPFGGNNHLQILSSKKETREEDFRYKKAIKDIKNGKLKGVCEVIESEPSIPINTKVVKDINYSKNKYSREQFFVEPRVFISWCKNKNQGYHIEPELAKYFDYNYYLKKKSLFFNEFVNLLCSKELPLPHELKEKVFAKESTHTIAKIVKDCISHKWMGIYETKIEIGFFDILDFLNKCKKEGQKLSNKTFIVGLVHYQELEKERYKNSKKSSEELKRNRCKLFLDINNCLLKEGINMILYKEMNPDFNKNALAYALMSMNKSVGEIERLFFADVDKGKVKVIVNSRNPDEYSVEPKKFTKWAIKNKFIDENHELTIAYRERCRNKIKTSDINQECLEWLLKECKESPSKPPKNKMPSLYKTGSMFEDAQEKFPNIGKREFERTWKKATENCPNWSKSGRK